MELDILRRPGAADVYGQGDRGAGAAAFPAHATAHPPPPLLHASRHFLGAAPATLRSLPFPPAGAGSALSHRLLAMGAWKQEVEQHRLCVYDLQVGRGGDAGGGGGGGCGGARPEELASWTTPGRVTALAAGGLGPSPPGPGGEPRSGVALLAATASGALCRLRLAMPVAPGALPGDVDLLCEADDCGATALLPWLWPTAGGDGGGSAAAAAAPSSSAAVALTAVDAAAAAPVAAVAGADGSLCLVRLDDGADGGGGRRPLSRLAPPRPGASLTCVRFVGGGDGGGGGLVVAAGTGGLEVWDGRAAAGGASTSSPAPAARAGWGNCASWPFPDGRPTCLATHPAVPYLIAAGGGGGVVALWDVRGGRGGGGGAAAASASTSLASPVATAAAPSGTTVWDVAFDPASRGGAVGVLFVTEGGELASADLGTGGGGGGGGGSAAPASILHAEPSAGAVALDVGPGGPGAGADLFVATDSECLVYVRRGGLGL